MKKIAYLLPIALLALIIASCSGTAQSGAGKGDVKLTNEMDSASYALGVNVASQVKGQGLTDMNFDAIAKAIRDVYEGNDLMIDETACMGTLQTFFQKAYEKQMAESQASSGDNLIEGQNFLAKNKIAEGVKTTESGLQYKVITQGTGAKPTATNQVRVHYHGTLIDGTVFDSSVDRGEPAEFALNGVIPGWTEGLQLMPVGSKYRFFIPSELAYGANPRPGGPIGPNMVLIFDVELLDILD